MVMNPDSNKFDDINCLQATSETAFDCELLLDVNCNFVHSVKLTILCFSWQPLYTWLDGRYIL
jgi:hypothetical protein